MTTATAVRPRTRALSGNCEVGQRPPGNRTSDIDPPNYLSLTIQLMVDRQSGFRVVRERKLVELLPAPQYGGVLEASGVVVKDGRYIVVFDNVRRIAQVGAHLKPGSADHE